MGGGFAHYPRPSRWDWDILKDYIHFYVLLGAIPCGIFVTCMNVFVGEAQLAPIPEGYKPKEWEYYKNPIHRLMIKYFKNSYQQSYESDLHYLWENVKTSEMIALKKEVKRQMKIHGDYKAWYHRDDVARYARKHRAGQEHTQRYMGAAPVGAEYIEGNKET